MQSQDYSPFGVILDGRHFTVGDDYRYGFQGYEADDEIKGSGNSYTTEFRQYDPRVGRWLTTDPKEVKYPDMSTYCAYGNNPILNIDVRGDTIARFSWDGKYLGWIDDGKAEWIGRRENAIKNVDPKTKKVTYTHEYFVFADPINDPKGLKSGEITHLVFVYEGDIRKMLLWAGAFDPDNQGPYDGLMYIKEEGKGNGKFDFSYTQIPSRWGSKDGVSSDPMKSPSSVLFYVKDDGMAHNHMNFGNYLYGAGGQALGLQLKDLLLGAHYNSLRNASSNGYGSQFDSKDDQLSITMGYLHGYGKDYDSISITNSSKNKNGNDR